MRQRGVRRFVATRKRYVVVVLALVVVVVGLWLYFRAWPPDVSKVSLQGGLAEATHQIVQYRDRVEVRLRLQLLEAAVIDGRRSSALRPQYRLLEDQLETVIARSEADLRSQLNAEFDGLLADLTRNRSAALRRMERIVDALDMPGGPGRQGGQK